MKTYNEMAEDVFRRRDEYVVKQKAKRKKTVGVSFTCALLAVLLGVGASQSGLLTPEVQTADDALYPGIKDTYGPDDNDWFTLPTNDFYRPIEEEPTQDSEGRTVISSYEGGSSAACYALPENGMFYFSIPLNKAFEEYGDEVLYRVVVRVFEDNKTVQGNKKLEKIAEKFYERGYTSALEVANNRWDYAVLTMLATEEELKNFKADEDNGYFFFLYEEPDGIGDAQNVPTE